MVQHLVQIIVLQPAVLSQKAQSFPQATKAAVCEFLQREAIDFNTTRRLERGADCIVNLQVCPTCALLRTDKVVPILLECSNTTCALLHIVKLIL